VVCWAMRSAARWVRSSTRGTTCSQQPAPTATRWPCMHAQGPLEHKQIYLRLGGHDSH
jgi:hypothetical protein